MAHKTLIGGTAYEISGGKTLVDGTAYSIKNGKTLVDGTAYDVELVKKVEITIEKPSSDNYIANSSYASVAIDDVVYSGSKSTTLLVSVGTKIYCRVAKTANAKDVMNSGIGLNGEPLAMASGDNLSTAYDYTVTSNATIEIGCYKLIIQGASAFAGTINITEE